MDIGSSEERGALFLDILQKQIVSIQIKYSCVVSTNSHNERKQGKTDYAVFYRCRNDLITSRTCKSAFKWLKVELQSLNIFIVDSDWLNDKGVVLP